MARRTLLWTLWVLALFELGARYFTQPSVLLALRVPSYATAYAHRLAMAHRAGTVGTLVLGDSTAERGIDACELARPQHTFGLNLAVPSGTTGEATELMAHTPSLHTNARVVYAVNPLNVATRSDWIDPSFTVLRRRSDLASTLLGKLLVLYGRRDTILAVFRSRLYPLSNRSEFNLQIGRTGRCGRDIAMSTPGQRPSAARRTEQVGEYSRAWLSVFRALPGPDPCASLAAALRSAAHPARAVQVVLMPLRQDFTDHLSVRWPGLLSARRAVWACAVRRAGVQGSDCASALRDPEDFVDPVHLNENGRQSFTRCLAAGGCCPSL